MFFRERGCGGVSGPSEYKIPVVVNLLQRSSRFLAGFGALISRVSVEWQGNMLCFFGAPFRSHCTKTVKVAVLAPDKSHTRDSDSLRSGICGVWVIYDR